MTDATPLASEQITQFGPFRLMETWDQRDEAVLLLVDYQDGDYPLDDARFAITIGHNNDHNVGDGEEQGWRFAGWCWSHDHYVEGKGKPVGWMPIPHILARAYTAFDGEPAALSATPAPSDQDASQAQGEGNDLAYERQYFERGFIAAYAWAVTKHADVQLSDDVIDHAWAHRDEGMDADDMLPVRAPGATGQDGVNWPSDGTCRICGSAPRNPTTGLCATCSDEAPTPTIPAGMVAWNGGDSAPEDWDGGSVLLRDGRLYTANVITAENLAWTHRGGKWKHGDIIAYTPLAAAPRQAEQQGVERLRSAMQRLLDAHAARAAWDDSDTTKRFDAMLREVELAEAEALAALNAPTGAVEKGEAK